VLGTDGFGRRYTCGVACVLRSDRPCVDRIAALKALDEGRQDPDVVRQAIDRYGRSGTGLTEPWLV
jgi:pyruvate dehydrogenase E1 component